MTKGRAEEAAEGLRLDEEGEHLRPKLVLPPNWKAAMERADHAVVKLETIVNGEIVAPEKLDRLRGYRFSEGSARVLWLLENWCGRWPGSLLQLSTDRLGTLLAMAGNERVFWSHGAAEALPSDSEILQWIAERAGERGSDKPVDAEPRPRSPSESRVSRRSAGVSSGDGGVRKGSIDGSEHYLAIELPSTEHSAYGEIRERVKADRFKLEPSNRKWWLRDRQRVLKFLAQYGDDIEARWGLVPTRNFRERTAHIGVLEPKVSARPVEGSADEFAVSVEWGGVSEEEVQAALRQGNPFLESGKRIFLVRPGQMEKVRKLRDQALAAGRSEHPQRVVVKGVALPEVEETLSELDPEWVSPGAWKESVRRLRDPKALEIPHLPTAFMSRLREYQRAGVAWFWNLHRNRLGGLLADEMGLGKTIQSLGLIGSLGGKEGAGRPALVVCPASLVENWVREAFEFLPEIRAHAYQGSGRELDFSALGAGDLLVTSYGTLRADRALFLKTKFSTIIGDEAQNFKNPSTETARVMRNLQADSRFALTGTPIENSITDLVGIGRFALPAVFGGRRAMAQTDAETVLARARPYLLRRTKKEVLADLPEKWETRRFVALSEPQRKLYQEVRRRTEERLFKLRSSGAGAGRMTAELWTELLRLRQATAEPRILDPDLPQTASAKAEGLMEVIAEAMDGGSRVLVFSQFTQTLGWLGKDLDRAGVSYCYLDGSTRNRQDLVERFNRDNSIPVFLLSLKAGGTGLNLTGADIVVHYDPWWNPAAEAQATDRAHRIGQTRKVQSIKLIGTDTVEEKVLRMQDEKRALLGSLFDGERASSSVFDWETLMGFLEE